jgi:diadenosine tetraphosphatase ApaH/serine/threonine PP2A family protein phosphatase
MIFLLRHKQGLIRAFELWAGPDNPRGQIQQCIRIRSCRVLESGGFYTGMPWNPSPRDLRPDKVNFLHFMRCGVSDPAGSASLRYQALWNLNPRGHRARFTIYLHLYSSDPQYGHTASKLKMDRFFYVNLSAPRYATNLRLVAY